MNLSTGFAVSAVIPVYNGAAFLKAAVESMLCQTRPVNEIMIVDDGSSDGTWELAGQMAQHHPGVIEVETLSGNLGVSVARNRGCQAAKSEWILLLDADDRVEPDLLEHYAAAISKYYKQWRQQPVLTYSAYRTMDAVGKEFPGVFRSQPMAPEECLGYELVRNQIISASGTLISKAVYCQSGGFDPGLRYAEDYELWLRLAQLGGFAYVDQPLVTLRRHHGNISRDLAKMLEGETRILKRYAPELIRQAITGRNLPEEVNAAAFVTVMYKIGLWETGFEESKRIITRKPDYAAGHFLQGIYFLHCQAWDEAKETFRQTVGLDPNHGAALNNLGALLLAQRELEEAQELLESALALYPNYQDAQSNLELIPQNTRGAYETLHFTWRELRPVLLTY